MSRFQPVSIGSRFAHGLSSIPRAVGTILSSRRVFLWSLLPYLLCLLLYVLIFSAVVVLDDDAVDMLVAPGGWWRTVMRAALTVAIPLTALIVGAFTYTLTCLVVAAPLYEWLSAAVEKRLTGAVQEEPFSLKNMLVDIWRALTATVQVLLIEIGVLIFGFLLMPVTSVLAALASAVLLCLEYCDYPMGRRRMVFKDRLRFARRHCWEMLGLGLPMLFVMAIPFVGALFLPIGVVAGTILFVEIDRPGGAEADVPRVADGPEEC